jgi:organic hydroperoxide reductase OsmC/OhrA
MSHEYRATVRWERGGAAFTDGRYSRAHTWAFDGGLEVPASSSPLSVRLPWSREDAVDPEEALVAAVSSCHMLFFLGFAAKAGFMVDSYEDRPVGIMEKNAKGKLFVSKITLDPRIAFSGGRRPSPQEIADLHHRSHEECYIANSVLAEVVVAGAPAHA